MVYLDVQRVKPFLIRVIESLKDDDIKDKGLNQEAID